MRDRVEKRGGGPAGMWDVGVKKGGLVGKMWGTGLHDRQICRTLGGWRISHVHKYGRTGGLEALSISLKVGEGRGRSSLHSRR